MVERKLNRHKKLQSKQIESNVLILFINLIWFESLHIHSVQPNFQAYHRKLTNLKKESNQIDLPIGGFFHFYLCFIH